MKRTMGIILGLFIIAGIIGVGFLISGQMKSSRYVNEAQFHYSRGDYERAAQEFENIAHNTGYDIYAKKAEEIRALIPSKEAYEKAMSLWDEQKYLDAVMTMEKIADNDPVYSKLAKQLIRDKDMRIAHLLKTLKDEGSHEAHEKVKEICYRLTKENKYSPEEMKAETPSTDKEKEVASENQNQESDRTPSEEYQQVLERLKPEIEKNKEKSDMVGKEVQVRVSEANLRKEPRLDAVSVGAAGKGAKLMVIDERSDGTRKWYRVLTMQPQSAHVYDAWISEKTLEKN